MPPKHVLDFGQVAAQLLVAFGVTRFMLVEPVLHGFPAFGEQDVVSIHAAFEPHEPGDGGNEHGSREDGCGDIWFQY